jgi:hypothetical protein
MPESKRELLEATAQALGMRWSHDPEITHDGLWIVSPMIYTCWDPLTKDQDAFFLMVKLGISVMPYPVYAVDKHSVVAKRYRSMDVMRDKNPTEIVEVYGSDPAAATRRAIVRCAAAIWEASSPVLPIPR